MTWVKLSDTFVDDPIWDELGPHAFMLHVAALSFCNRSLTDGLLKHSRARAVAPAVDDPQLHAKALIEAGIWTDLGDRIKVAEYVDDMRRADGRGDEQPSRATVLAGRRQSADRQAEWRRKRAKGKGNAGSNGVTSGVDNASPSRPPKGRGRCRHGNSAAVATDGTPNCATCEADNIVVDHVSDFSTEEAQAPS